MGNKPAGGQAGSPPVGGSNSILFLTESKV